MDYEAAKLRINKLGLSSVPCLEHLITSSHTDSLSMGLEIAFMTPTDAAKDLEHGSMPVDNIEDTRIVRRTVKPDLGATRQTMSGRSLSKDSGEIITVSMKPNCSGEAGPGRRHVS